MIKIETAVINNKKFKKTYSDENFKIKNIVSNEIYIEAVDLLSSENEYEETDIKIEPPEEETENDSN